MVAWSEATIRAFRKVTEEFLVEDYREFCPAYSSALHDLLEGPSNGALRISESPQLPPSAESAVSFATFVAEEQPGAPVFVLALRAAEALYSSAVRKEADAHIRQRLADAMAKCPLETLYAASAFGGRVCFYTGTMRDGKVHVEPPLDDFDPDDPAPLRRWSCDVRRPEGMKRFEQVAGDIGMLYGRHPDRRVPWTKTTTTVSTAQWWLACGAVCVVLGILRLFSSLSYP